MAKLGLPYLNIRFEEMAATTIGRSKRGIVAMVIQEKTLKGNYRLYTVSDIPEGVSEKNREQIELALMGYVKSPHRVILVIQQSESADVPKFDVTSAEFKYLETVRWDYLAIPFIDAEDSQSVLTWIKNLNDNYGKRCKAVLPNTAGDTDRIVNYTMPMVKSVLKEYKTNEYLSRVAGFICGTPGQIATTYGPLPELIDCTYYTKDELEEKIGNGEFVLVNDGTKIKVARGVNSLVTTSQIKGESFRKIKIIDIMDAMADDITIAVQDGYIGKYANSYDNKVLLMSAIQGYLQILENDGLLAKKQSVVMIDIEAQKAFLKSIAYKTIDGRSVEEMEIFEIKEADTKDNVFIQIKCKILDAIEEVDIRVEI